MKSEPDETVAVDSLFPNPTHSRPSLPASPGYFLPFRHLRAWNRLARSTLFLTLSLLSALCPGWRTCCPAKRRAPGKRRTPTWKTRTGTKYSTPETRSTSDGERRANRARRVNIDRPGPVWVPDGRSAAIEETWCELSTVLHSNSNSNTVLHSASLKIAERVLSRNARYGLMATRENVLVIVLQRNGWMSPWK